jgi:threonine synthase
MDYISTRDAQAAPVGFVDALLGGLAPDGGLYVPTAWPQLDMADLAGRPYAKAAEAVLSPFIGDAIEPAVLRRMLADTYAPPAFAHQSVAPLRQLGPDLWLMELFHGPTIAFKDVALGSSWAACLTTLWPSAGRVQPSWAPPAETRALRPLRAAGAGPT